MAVFCTAMVGSRLVKNKNAVLDVKRTVSAPDTASAAAAAMLIPLSPKISCSQHRNMSSVRYQSQPHIHNISS
eukprot:scaffold17375_cov22-Prasinocladus_malaysianus.AAC.1